MSIEIKNIRIRPKVVDHMVKENSLSEVLKSYPYMDRGRIVKAIQEYCKTFITTDNDVITLKILTKGIWKDTWIDPSKFLNNETS